MKIQLFDERYFKHRYRATSHAAVVAAVLLAGFFLYGYSVQRQLRWDLAIVLGAMALTKLAAMIYYRCTD